MVRYTVRDREKTVSFVGDLDLAKVLVAGCAGDPLLLEDLLLAAEPLRPGTVARVMHALLRHDMAFQNQSTVPLFDAFEVSGHRTEAVALRPDNDGLLVIDLPARSIDDRLAGEIELASRGSVRIPVSGTDLERETVYSLSSEWSVVRGKRADEFIGERRYA